MRSALRKYGRTGARDHRSALLGIVATQKVLNSEHLSGEPMRYKLPKSTGYLPLIEVPIMSLRRRRQDFIDTVIRDARALLAPIAATIAMILLWFFG